MYMRSVYKSLEKAAYRAAWGLTLALGMSCTSGKEEVKPIVVEPEIPVKEIPAQESPIQYPISEPIEEPTRRRDPFEGLPLNVRLGSVSGDLYTAVRSSKAYRKGNMETKRLELAEVHKFTNRAATYING